MFEKRKRNDPEHDDRTRQAWRWSTFRLPLLILVVAEQFVHIFLRIGGIPLSALSVVYLPPQSVELLILHLGHDYDICMEGYQRSDVMIVISEM